MVVMSMASDAAARPTMRAFQLFGKGDLRPADLPRPVAGPGEVVIRVRRAGICGSDVHYFSHGQAGSFVPRRPFVLGHEFAGDVVELGPDVAPALLGARVAVDPSMPCGACEHCRSGRYNLCESMRFYGSASCDPHIDGGFAEYLSAPATNCHVLAPGVGWGEAAMLEPLSVAVHAVNRAGAVAGKSALVTGGGAIGQLVALVLRAFGARLVALSDVADFPRRAALAGGADAGLDAGDPHFESLAQAVSPGGFDVVVEAAGSPAALGQALAVIRRGGTIVQVGTLPAQVSLPLNAVMAREISLVGSFRFAHAFPTALGLVESGRLKLEPLISGVYALQDMPQAMRRAVDKHEAIKIQIEP